MRVRPGCRNPETNVANNLARFWRWIKSMTEPTSSRKRMEVTVETDQVLTIRRRRSVRCWCQQCGRDVEMVELKELQALMWIREPMATQILTAPSISAGRGEGGWHWSQAVDGSPLVCLESLLKSGEPQG